MAALLDGTAPSPTPIERALIDLARASCERPARLAPADLAPLRALAGDGAVDYALVAGAFHFINRIADLLHVDDEMLPAPLRRVEWLRRTGVRLASLFMRRMDLANRRYESTLDEAWTRVAALLARAGVEADRSALAAAAARPKLLEILELALRERDERSSLARETIATVQRAVEAALPACREDTEGFHARPSDPVEAFAFVGTRYAARTAEAMIEALRRAGYDDLGILDLAIAIADANQWARTSRLLGLDPALFYLAPPAGEVRRQTAEAGA